LVAEGETVEPPTYHAAESSSSSDDTAPPGDFVMYTNVACRTDATVSFFNVELTGVYAYPWQCRRYCANHPACKAFTYDSVTSRCFYLRSCEGRFVNQAATSGVSASIDTGFDPTTAESPDTDEVDEEESSTETTGDTDESEGRHYAGEYSMYADAECVVEDVLDSQRDVPTVEACQVACDAFPGCGGFTYNPDRERCYLVQDCTERSSEGGNASGSKAVPSPIPVESDDDDDDDSPLTSTATNNASDDDDDSSTEAPIPPDDPSSVEEDAGSQASDNSVDNDDPPPNVGTSTTTENPPEDEQSPVSPTDTDDEAEEEVVQEYPVYVSPIQYGNLTRPS
jgi:hypothetical protein